MTSSQRCTAARGYLRSCPSTRVLDTRRSKRLSAGVPPVLLDTEVAREVCGEAAVYVRNGDIGAITAALDGLLFDEDMRSRVLRTAPAVLARYSWPRAAAETLAALESVA